MDSPAPPTQAASTPAAGRPAETVVVRTPAEAVALARRLERQGRAPEAEQLYRRTLERSPDDVAALRGLGVLAHKARRHLDAADLLGRAVGLDPLDPDLHNDLGGVLGELGRHEQAAAAFREALRLRPGYGEVLGNLGVALQRLKRDDEAVATLRRACALVPRSPVAHTQLGATLAKLGRHEEAVAAFGDALAAKPAHAEALGRTGNSLRALGRHADAVDALRGAIRLKPNYPEAHANLGLAYLDQNRAAESAAAFAAAIRLKPDYAEAHWNHGLALLLAGDWARGWPEYEWRRPLRNDAVRRRDAPVPMWDGSDPAGKTVLLHAEQGFGDAVMFARFAAALADRGARVVLQVRPELVRLCATVPGVAKAVGPGDPVPPLDFHSHLMSLPAVLGTTPASIPGRVPYVRPDPAQVEAWGRRVAAGPPRAKKVGIVWGGNVKPLATRACPLANWLPVAQVPGVSLYSLQKGEPANQAKCLPAGMALTDLTADLADFADTAALVANLDLVVTIDTSVAHLAGALGKPTWVLLPHVSDWRWMLGRDDSPWYPTVRLFRQEVAGDWHPVIARVAAALSGWASGAAEAGLARGAGPARVTMELTTRERLDRLAWLEARAAEGEGEREGSGERAALRAASPEATSSPPAAGWADLLAAHAELAEAEQALRSGAADETDLPGLAKRWAAADARCGRARDALGRGLGENPSRQAETLVGPSPTAE
jgi:tetratricopeptide (TPR) repeat protein